MCPTFDSGYVFCRFVLFSVVFVWLSACVCARVCASFSSEKSIDTYFFVVIVVISAKPVPENAIKNNAKKKSQKNKLIDQKKYQC